MTPDPLSFLVELREAVGLTQKEVARRFDLAERQGYKSVEAWEKGESAPKARLRSRFLRYLWDDLRLHKEPTRFVAYWAILVERWHWEPLSDAERIALHLPPPAAEESTRPLPTATSVAGSVVGGNVTTNGGHVVGRDQFILHFSQLHQQAADTLDASQLAAQITEYLTWLEDSTRMLELRGIAARDTRVSLPLAEIFVPLRAALADQRRQEEAREIALDQVLTVGERLAVIGGPGSGKSTVLQYIAWVLAMALLENDGAWAEAKLGVRLSAAEPPLPIYLPLSAYARLRFHSSQGSETLTFPDFIQHYLKQSHCTIGGLPPAFFARLLQSGRSVILLLDGLDEVADEQQRAIVTQTIENLVAGRKGLRVVVTCRSVAYKGQAILTRDFRQVMVQPLDEVHVTQLVEQAYGAVYVNNQEERAARTAELLTGIDRLEGEHARRRSAEERLINSPLLVRMLLIVHLNDRKLPQHRADLYRRFVETMLNSDHVFDREVAQALRNLRGNNLALMSHLAFAMHSQGEEQGREIERETLEALLDPAYAAETPAFLQLIHLRGTLVEERNGFYRFLHLAFQEYLAARYLAQEYWRNEGMKPTFGFLAQQTPHSWWREVATLLPGYLREESPLNAKRVISALAALPEWATVAADWSPDVQLAAAEIAATATLEWFPDDGPLRQAIVARLLHFFNTPVLLNRTQPRLRALAGRTLAALGDPRFRADAWYLPADPLLGFIELPGGTFLMGSDPQQDAEADKNETPQHPITLPTFYMARYPVTVGQWSAYLAATGIHPWSSYNLADPDNHPVLYITWFEATRYCKWLTQTLRTWAGTPAPLAAKLAQGWQVMLPSEAEWERAARGLVPLPEPVEGSGSGSDKTALELVEGGGRRYPWGNDPVDPTRANYAKSGIGNTSAVGCFPAGVTPEGVEELSGNVWEWTRSRYITYPYPNMEQEKRERERIQHNRGKTSDSFVQRGGAYHSHARLLRAPQRGRHIAGSSVNGNYGFRLVVGAAASWLVIE